MEFLRSEGIVDKHRLTHQLAIPPEELQQVLADLLAKGFIRTITRKGIECQQCAARMSCPGSRVHVQNPKKRFKAYQLTAAGMRYHRSLRDQEKTQKGF
jgi:hypothetical protein